MKRLRVIPNSFDREPIRVKIASGEEYGVLECVYPPGSYNISQFICASGHPGELAVIDIDDVVVAFLPEV